MFTSLAAAIGGIAKAMHDFAGNIESIQRLSTATGFGVERMRELEAVARRFGGTAAEVRAGMRGLADSFHDIKRGGPIFQELAAAGLPRFANQLRNAKTDAERLEIVLRQLDRLKDPFEKRRLLGMLHGPEVFADATGEQRKRLEEEYRKTNPPLDKEGLDKVKRYEDSLWKSGNAFDAIVQKNVGDLDTLATQLDLMATGTLKASDALGSFNKTMDAVREHAEQTTREWGKKIPKSPGRPLTIWEQLFGLKPENQSYNDPGGGKTKDVIKSATAEGVVDGFLKFAMLVGNRGGDGGARTIPASYTPGGGGTRTRQRVIPPQDNDPPSSARPALPHIATRPPPDKPGATNPPPPSSAGPMGGGGADPNQRGRPNYIGGEVTIDGKKFHWGSGGAGRGSIPWGDYPINVGPGAGIGPWGQSHGSIATIGKPGGVIDDPRYPGNPRTGIQIHTGSGSYLDHLYTLGCFKVSRAEWPAFKKALLEKAGHGPMMLHIGRDGIATITTRGERGKPDMAKPPEPPTKPREKLHDPRTQSAAFKGDATVRIDVNGLPRGSRMAASSSGIFSSVELHRGSTLPLASESA
jgi:hypothetical protein